MIHTSDTVKVWLSGYGELIKDVDNILERIEILRERAFSPSSPILDGMPHQKGNRTDRIGHTVAHYDFLEREAKAKFERAKILYKEIDTSIKLIHGKGSADKKAVLQMKYLDLAEWDEVLDMLFMKKENFLEKEDSYRRRVFKLHQVALSELAELLNNTQMMKEQEK